MNNIEIGLSSVVYIRLTQGLKIVNLWFACEQTQAYRYTDGKVITLTYSYLLQ
jgi:hypothetical protein